jgi:hypothetical protein
MMKNDKPTSLRRDHGYTGARSAGVVGYREPYDGELMNFGVHEQHAEREIAALARQYPSLKQRFAEIARQHVRQKHHRVQDILLVMRWEIEEKRKAGTLNDPRTP